MIDHPDPQTLYSLASSPFELATIRAGPEAFLEGAGDEGTSGWRDFGQERPEGYCPRFELIRISGWLRPRSGTSARRRTRAGACGRGGERARAGTGVRAREHRQLAKIDATVVL